MLNPGINVKAIDAWKKQRWQYYHDPCSKVTTGWAFRLSGHDEAQYIRGTRFSSLIHLYLFFQ